MFMFYLSFTNGAIYIRCRYAYNLHSIEHDLLSSCAVNNLQTYNYKKIILESSSQEIMTKQAVRVPIFLFRLFLRSLGRPIMNNSSIDPYAIPQDRRSSFILTIHQNFYSKAKF